MEKDVNCHRLYLAMEVFYVTYWSSSWTKSAMSDRGASLPSWWGDRPDGVAFGQDGKLLVAPFDKGVVAVIDPEGKVIAELAVGGLTTTNVAFGGTSLKVTKAGKGQVVRLHIVVWGQGFNL